MRLVCASSLEYSPSKPSFERPILQVVPLRRSILRHFQPANIDLNQKIKPRINKAQTGVETTGVKHSLNPFDELSIEEAVRLRERKGPIKVEDIIALSAGGPKTPDVLRTAMAMGADRAFHIDVPDKGDGGPEPLTIAKMLRAVVEKENINLVLLGKQAIDGDQGQTGQMLAGLLGWPQATQASKVEIKDDAGTVEIVHEVDGGVETLRAKLPMVITTDLRLNEPRYASLPNIMKAKKKPLEKKTLADLGVEDTRRLKTLQVTGMYFLTSLPGWILLILLCRAPTTKGWRQGRGCRRPCLQAEGAWCSLNELLFVNYLSFYTVLKCECLIRPDCLLCKRRTLFVHAMHVIVWILPREPSHAQYCPLLSTTHSGRCLFIQK
jgi:electron transfer flavoprotein beta subunit